MTASTHVNPTIKFLSNYQTELISETRLHTSSPRLIGEAQILSNSAWDLLRLSALGLAGQVLFLI